MTCHRDLSVGLLEHPHNMAASFPRTSDLRKREQNRIHCVFCDLTLKVILLHFHKILLVTLNRIVLFIMRGAT